MTQKAFAPFLVLPRLSGPFSLWYYFTCCPFFALHLSEDLVDGEEGEFVGQGEVSPSLLSCFLSFFLSTLMHFLHLSADIFKRGREVWQMTPTCLSFGESTIGGLRGVFVGGGVFVGTAWSAWWSFTLLPWPHLYSHCTPSLNPLKNTQISFYNQLLCVFLSSTPAVINKENHANTKAKNEVLMCK